MNTARRVIWGVCALIAITVIGVIGYIVIEGWSFLDSLYMTAITITTVGYDEVHSLTAGGQLFSIFLMFGGIGGALYTLTGIIQYIIEGNIGTTLGRRRMKNKIARLKGHFILCGFGRVGDMRSIAGVQQVIKCTTLGWIRADDKDAGVRVRFGLAGQSLYSRNDVGDAKWLRQRILDA